MSIPACLWPVFVPLLSSSWGSLRDPTVLYLQSLGPMQSLGKLKSPGFTVTEALTCSSAKRGQPTLLKVCSWTNLKTAPRPGPEANPGQGWSQKATEKVGFTFLNRAKNIRSLLPFPPITASQAHPMSPHPLCRCPVALPSSAGLKGAVPPSCFYKE